MVSLSHAGCLIGASVEDDTAVCDTRLRLGTRYQLPDLCYCGFVLECALLLPDSTHHIKSVEYELSVESSTDPLVTTYQRLATPLCHYQHQLHSFLRVLQSVVASTAPASQCSVALPSVVFASTMSSVPVSVARPSPLPASTSANRAELIQLISILAGVGATIAVNPDPVVSTVLSHAAHLYRLLYSPSAPSSSTFAPAAYVESVLNSAASYVDEQAIKLQVRQRLMEFDEQSPIDHRTLVKLAIGVVAFASTRVLCRTLLR